MDSDQNLNDLNDVEISSPTNAQALIYQSSTGLWKNLAQAGSGGGGRSYTGVSPITVDNDNNIVGLNVLSSSDWNGTFDGQQGTFYLNWANDNNRLFSLLSLDNNNSFDARYNKTTDSNNTGRLNFQVIANPPWRTEPDTNIFTSGVADCNSTSFVFGFNSNGTTDCRTDQTGGATDINGTDVFPNFVKIATDLNVLRDANILRLLNVYGNIKGFSNLTISGTITADSGTFGSGADTIGIATAARSIVFGTGGGALITTGASNFELSATGGGTKSIFLTGYNRFYPTTDNAVDLGVDSTNRFKNLYLALGLFSKDVNALGDVNGLRICIGTDCKTAWPSGGDGFDQNVYSLGIMSKDNNRFLIDVNGAKANFNDINSGSGNIFVNSTKYAIQKDLNLSAMSLGCSLSQFMTGSGTCRASNTVTVGGNISLVTTTLPDLSSVYAVHFNDFNYRGSPNNAWSVPQVFTADINSSKKINAFDLNVGQDGTVVRDFNVNRNTVLNDLNVMKDGNFKKEIRVDGNATFGTSIKIVQGQIFCLNWVESTKTCTAYLTYDGTKSIWVGG